MLPACLSQLFRQAASRPRRPVSESRFPRSAGVSASWKGGSKCNCSSARRAAQKLTDAGTRLFEHASRGIEALLEAEQLLVSDQARLKGRLRLSLPQTFTPGWDLLEAFQRRYPDIEVYVHSTERRMDLIEDGIDVALRVGAIVP